MSDLLAAGNPTRGEMVPLLCRTAGRTIHLPSAIDGYTDFFIFIAWARPSVRPACGAALVPRRRRLRALARR
ncbi:hypothetical protein, partial [Craurococcus roseus]|uniref:hypothetical protein n=1 Tax=Craurococcus roseus TaxID=77585 RepID=UPI0031D4DED6